MEAFLNGWMVGKEVMPQLLAIGVTRG